MKQTAILILALLSLQSINALAQVSNQSGIANPDISNGIQAFVHNNQDGSYSYDAPTLAGDGFNRSIYFDKKSPIDLAQAFCNRVNKTRITSSIRKSFEGERWVMVDAQGYPTQYGQFKKAGKMNVLESVTCR